MSAYLISDFEVRDAGAFEIYRVHAAEAVEKYGGRFLVRGGRTSILEGEWRPRTMVIIEFPSIEQARAWYASPEYAPALAMHRMAFERNLVLAEGYTPPE